MGNKDPTADFDFDDRDSEEESKSDHEDEDEQKIDVKTTEDGQRLFGLQRLNTEHRFKITRQMSALQKLDLDGDGELEPDEIIKAYMEDEFSRDEAQQKIDELRGKYDIDGDGVVSLKEALNTELANAMEEEVEEDQEKFKKDEEQHQDEHKNHTKERLR